MKFKPVVISMYCAGLLQHSVRPPATGRFDIHFIRHIWRISHD